MLEALAARVAEAGETFRSFFDTAALAARLQTLGFAEIEDLSGPEIAARYLSGAPRPTSGAGGHILRAATR